MLPQTVNIPQDWLRALIMWGRVSALGYQVILHLAEQTWKKDGIDAIEVSVGDLVAITGANNDALYRLTRELIELRIVVRIGENKGRKSRVIALERNWRKWEWSADPAQDLLFKQRAELALAPAVVRMMAPRWSEQAEQLATALENAIVAVTPISDRPKPDSPTWARWRQTSERLITDVAEKLSRAYERNERERERDYLIQLEESRRMYGDDRAAHASEAPRFDSRDAALKDLLVVVRFVQVDNFWSTRIIGERADLHLEKNLAQLWQQAAKWTRTLNPL